MENKTIIIANAHGCYNELKLLVKKCDVQRDDAVYMLGNVLNGGPEPYATMNYLLHQCKNIQFVKGDFEKQLETALSYDACVTIIRHKYPNLELALYHLDILRNAPEYVQLPMCYLVRYGMPKLRDEKINTPVIINGGMTHTNFYKPYIFTDAINQLCVAVNTHVLQGGNLTAIVIANNESNVYNWDYVSVNAMKKYVN